MAGQEMNWPIPRDHTFKTKNTDLYLKWYRSQAYPQPVQLFFLSVIFLTSVIILIFLLLLLPVLTQEPIHAEALQYQIGDSLEKSGGPGTEVTYSIRLINDNPYPIDVLGEVEESAWNASFPRTEFVEVLPSDSVTFFIVVRIPIEPDQDFSETILVFSERPSYQTVIQYEPDIQLAVNTTLNEKNEKPSDASNVEELSDYIVEFGFLTTIFIIIITGIHWYCRGTLWKQRKPGSGGRDE